MNLPSFLTLFRPQNNKPLSPATQERASLIAERTRLKYGPYDDFNAIPTAALAIESINQRLAKLDQEAEAIHADK